jgi:GIY-YIG catalytic domain
MMHLGGRHEFSTFRLSLGSVLAEARGRDEIDELLLTHWMHDHLRLIPLPVTDADTLGKVETAVLTALDPPLNLDKVGRNALRARLSELRKKYGRTRRSSTAASGD